MKPVDFIIIDKIIPIFKNCDPALNIEVVRVKDSEDNSCQFNIVTGKGQYQIGDRALYVQPDFSVPPENLFNDYYFPGGDETKCKLGKKGRIRAVKFNFSFKGESDRVGNRGLSKSNQTKNPL